MPCCAMYFYLDPNMYMTKYFILFLVLTCVKRLGMKRRNIIDPAASGNGGDVQPTGKPSYLHL